MDETTFSDFAASGYSYIPVIRQLPLNHQLPELLRCFPESSVWQLEVEHQSYVYLTLDYHSTVTAWGQTIEVQQAHEHHTWPDTAIWSYIEDLHAGLTVPPLNTLYADLPPLMGGMIGLLPRTPSHTKIVSWPDALWLVMQTVIIMDMHGQSLWLVAYDDPIHPHAWARLNQKLDALTERLVHIPTETELARTPPQIDQPNPDMLISVAQTLGQSLTDTYQAMSYASVTSSRPGYQPDYRDFLAYQADSHVAYWLQQPLFSVLGASDNVHLTLTGRDLMTRLASPVASPDDALASLLWDSLRNDISKVALPGSMRLVNHTPVDGKHHWLKQSLYAQIGEDTTAFDVIRAYYPNHAYLGVPKADALLALSQATAETSLEPHPLGCHIAMVGWDRTCFCWVSQKATLYQLTPDKLANHDAIYTQRISSCDKAPKGERAGVYTEYMTDLSSRRATQSQLERRRVYEEIGMPVLAGQPPRLTKDKP